MKELNYRKGSNLELVYGLLKRLKRSRDGWLVVCGEDWERARAMGLPSFRTNVSIVSRDMGIKVWVNIEKNKIFLLHVSRRPE